MDRPPTWKKRKTRLDRLGVEVKELGYVSYLRPSSQLRWRRLILASYATFNAYHKSLFINNHVSFGVNTLCFWHLVYPLFFTQLLLLLLLFFFFEKEGLIYLMNRVYCGDGGSPCFIYIYIYIWARLRYNTKVLFLRFPF